MNLDNQKSILDSEIFNIDYFGIFKRNKRLFFLSSVTIFIFGAFIHLRKKPIWGGEFQIVISEKPSLLDKKIPKDFKPDLLGSSFNQKLKTEIKILESPSVLLPVYEYVRNYKNSLKNIKAPINYSDWFSKNLSVALTRNTAVLNVKYQDNDKTLVENVLNLIASEYQSYTYRDREKKIKNLMKYFDDQIQIYKIKVNNSYKDAQEYALKWDLIENPNTAENQVSIRNEQLIFTYKNRIKQLEELLNEIKKIGSNEDILNYASSLEGKELKTSFLLESINQEIDDKKYIYTNNDKEFKNLLLKRDRLRNLLKIQITNYLKSQLEFSKASLKSVSRPADVIIKYKEFLRNAFNQSLILTSLENDRYALSLEKAKENERWALISKPKVLDTKIGPSKLSSLIVTFFTIFIVSPLIIFIKDRKSGIIYSNNELKNYLDMDLIGISNGIEEINLISYKLIKKYIRSDITIGFFMAGLTNNNLEIKKMKSYLKENINSDFIFSNKLEEILNCDKKFIVTQTGEITRKELIKFNSDININDSEINGWIAIV